jgi:hypothetical protein
MILLSFLTLCVLAEEDQLGGFTIPLGLNAKNFVIVIDLKV